MTDPTRSQAIGVMAYVEGWLLHDFPEVSNYLVTHMDEIADSMVNDGCAKEDS